MDVSRARGLLCEQVRALARRRIELPVGTACFDDVSAHLYDANAVLVERPAAWEDVVAAAEGAHRAAGHVHRRVLVVDPETMAVAVEAGPRAGWTVDRWVAMAARRAPERPGDAGAAEEVDLAGFLRFEARSVAARPWVTTSELAREVIAHVERLAEVLAARFLVAYDEDGRPAAGCHLYPTPGALEVAEVVTLEASRGRGHARALLARAAAEAAAVGAELHLWADADDWPRRLYDRLGYDALGEVAMLGTGPDPGQPPPDAASPRTPSPRTPST